MCFKYMKSPLQAEECFKEILTYSGKLKANNYLIPYSLYEYAVLMMDEGELQSATEMLSRARYDFELYMVVVILQTILLYIFLDRHLK